MKARDKKNDAGSSRPSLRDRLASLNKYVPPVFAFLYIAVLLYSIVFKIYKAHIAGIVYDESFTCLHFGKDIYHSPTLEHPNFHVLTALFDQWSRHLFGSYEHYIRIPGMIFSTVFSVCTAFIVDRTVKSRPIKIALLTLILFNPFVFNLSFLARGYSIALAGIYIQLAFIVWLIDNRIKKRFRWAVIVMMAFTDFLTFGAMPSCIWVLFGTNLIFVLFYSGSVFEDKTGRLKSALINAISIPVVSLIPLFLLYRENFSSILSVRDEFGWKSSWFKYMTILLRDKLIDPHNRTASIMHWLLVIVVCISVIVLLYRAAIAIKNKKLFSFSRLNDSGTFFIVTAAVVLVMYWFHRHVLNVSIGFPRNGVVLIPLSLIAAAIVIDRALRSLNKKPATCIVSTITAAAMFIIAFANLPSAHLINVYTWDFQSSAGPLLRKLKSIDPDKTWVIALSQEGAWSLNLPLSYYRQFGYKYALSRDGKCDVVVFHNDKDKIPKMLYLEKQYFDKFNCTVGVTQSVSNSDKVYLDAHVK